MDLGARIPSGPLEQKWERRLREGRLVGPSNRRKYTLLVVGSGLAGASAAATLAELGYRVHCFSFHDSPRRAHSIAAQGGINAAKNYRNDGDSVWRLFYDTLKGGDFRSREANVYRLAQVSNRIIDQCVAQGVPFAREYGGLLATRSFGGALVSRTFYARGQDWAATSPRRLPGARAANQRGPGSHASEDRNARSRHGRRTGAGNHRARPPDGRAEGVRRRCCDPRDRRLRQHLPSLDQRARLERDRDLARVPKGRRLRQPLLHADPSDLHPVSGPHQSKLTLMSESLRNDGRVWVPKLKGDQRTPRDIPESERDYFLERRYPTYGNLAPRDIASRSAKEICDQGRGVGPGGRGVYLDLGDAIERLGAGTIRERYGNVLEMYERITGEHPYRAPMRIYPAVHYTMGGLWVDYDLRSTLPGLYVLGEANFSDHGANRLGASALMQGLADGYFIVPNTIAAELARFGQGRSTLTIPRFETPSASCRQSSSACSPREAREPSRTTSARWVASSGNNAAWRAASAGCPPRSRASRRFRATSSEISGCRTPASS